VVDIAGSGISELESRLVEGMLWSEHYFEVRRSLSIRAEDSERLKTINDFDGLSIAYTPGSTGELDSRKRASSLVHLLPYEDEDQAIEDLRTRKIDAIARGDVSSLYDAKVNPELSVADRHYYEPREHFVFALPQNNVELTKALNAFLIEMNASGAVDYIVADYLEEK
jgi:ABC-type amino acid transport substrate-binding protein